MIYRFIQIALTLSLLASCSFASSDEEISDTIKVVNSENAEIFYFRKGTNTYTTYGESDADNRNIAKERAKANLKSNKQFLLMSECQLGVISENIQDTSTNYITRYLYEATCFKQ